VVPLAYPSICFARLLSYILLRSNGYIILGEAEGENGLQENYRQLKENMGKTRRISTRSLFLIEELARKRLAPVEIRKELEFRGLDIVSLPTIRDIARQTVPADQSSQWELEAAETIDSHLVLDVLGSVIQETDGQITRLTRLEAQWITSLRTAQPDLTSDHGRIDTANSWVIYQLAQEYIQRRQHGESSVDLDTFLAWAPWRDFHRCFTYNVGLLEGKLSAPPVWLAIHGMPSSQHEGELPGDDLSDMGDRNYFSFSLSFVAFQGPWGGLSIIDFGVEGPSAGSLVTLERGFTAFSKEVIDLKDEAARLEYKRRAFADYYGSLTGDKEAFFGKLKASDGVPSLPESPTG